MFTLFTAVWPDLAKIVFDIGGTSKQWLCQSWQSVWFWHQKQTSAIVFYLLYRKDQNKEKEAGNAPSLKETFFTLKTVKYVFV